MSVRSQWIGRLARRGQWPAWAVLVVALAATVVAWRTTHRAVESEARFQFEIEAERIALLVARRLRAYEQVLRGGVSVFDTLGTVSRQQWRSYVDGLQIGDNYPGIQGIGYAEVVSPAELPAHIRRIRAEGFPDYMVHPQGERPVYSAIVYLEPFDWRNQRAFGFDMLSEPTRRAAMERARDTGEPSVSGKVTLVQETEADTQPGFLMYLPIYRSGRTPPTPEARREELVGYVYAPFRMRDLMTAMLGARLRNIAVEVFDGGVAAPEALLFDSAGEAGQTGRDVPLFVRELPLWPAGHQWTLRLATLPGASIDSREPLTVLAAGSMVSGLLFLIVWSMARNAERSRQQEADFRYLFEKNPSILWVYDRKTLGFLAVNEAAVAAYGYAPEEFREMRITDIRPPEDLSRLHEFMKLPAVGMRRAGEWRHRTKAGEELIVDVTSYPIVFAGRDASLVVARDVTQRARAEAAQRTSETLRAAVLESALDAVIVLDEDGRILEFNPAAERTFGHARADVIGKELAEVAVPPRDRAAHRDGIKRFRADVESRLLGRRIELTAMRADGTEFPVEIAITAARVDGRTVFTGYLRDITELRKAQAELQQAQKMEAVGRLTGGVAHDFNNLLTVVVGNAELLMTHLAPASPAQQHAEQIVRVAARAAELTRQLLAFARRQPLEPQQIDLNRLVSGLEGIMRRTLGEDIEIQVDFADRLWAALADPAQVETALLNLAINARDAMPTGGKLTVETRNVRLDEDYAAANAEVAAGDYVMLAVTDSGVGMDADTLARAFEPFFTTKEVGKGSGLGLSMIYGFVKQSGGHAKIYSEPGQGTTVRLYLPRLAQAAGEPARQATPSEAMPTGSETILVVEDDKLVRRSVEAQLRGLGYAVLSAPDGPQALEMLRSAEPIDLLFTDVVMPGGMSGPELVVDARRLRPDIRVLYTSGYAESAITHQGRLGTREYLLNKPYRRHELAAKVRKALDEPA